MSRWVSLIVLLAVIAVTGVVLYRVMAAFLLPLFLAAVLAVIFRPLHLRIEQKVPNRPALSSLLTTTLILLTVLLPIGGVATLAVREGFGAVSGDVLDRAGVRIERLREHLELELPFRTLAGDESDETVSLTDIGNLVEQLPPTLPEFDDITPGFTRQLEELTVGLELLNRRLTDMAYLAEADSDDSDDSSDMKRVKRMLRGAGPDAFQPVHETVATLWMTLRYANEGPGAFPMTNPAPHAGPLETQAEEAVASREDRADSTSPNSDGPATDGAVTLKDLRWRYRRVPATYAAFRIDLLGGPLWSWLTDSVNPSSTQLDSLLTNFQTSLRSLLPSVAGQATAMVGSSLLDLAIMALSVFYFLKDGPAMGQTLMKLSPLDDRYERELVSEFESVSRAVVLATLLSALAQGLLSGAAYYFIGFNSIFMLTSLTIILAMVPFIGAAAIWFPACLWLAIIEERYLAAMILFVYGATVVSMADNLIKPYVLHGQSKLHPLLALLSVLGGVQALGPIGILVGPMVVSFLQALLNILHNELHDMDEASAASRAARIEG